MSAFCKHGDYGQACAQCHYEAHDGKCCCDSCHLIRWRKRIAELEQQVAALKEELAQYGPTAAENALLRGQVSASQALEANLRKAFERCRKEMERRGLFGEANFILREMDIPADDSALQSALKAERERCIAVCEETADIYRQMHNPEAENVADACADAIRGIA